MCKKARNRTSKSPSMRIYVLLECTSRNAMPMTMCDVTNNSRPSRCAMDDSSAGRSQQYAYGSSAMPVDYASNQIAVESVTNDYGSTNDADDPLGLDSFFRELKDVRKY